MIHFGAIEIKVGRILRMHTALIEGIGGPSRTEAEHPLPRFGQSLTVDKVFFQAHNALPRNPQLT